MDIIRKIAEELGVGQGQVDAAVKLIDEGCTIPFIARYRKEATGGLNDEQLRTLGTRLTALRNLEEKKAKVLESIEAQGKLTPELAAQIEAELCDIKENNLNAIRCSHYKSCTSYYLIHYHYHGGKFLNYLLFFLNYSVLILRPLSILHSKRNPSLSSHCRNTGHRPSKMLLHRQ